MKIMQWFHGALSLLLVGGVAVCGYSWVRARIAADIYAQKLLTVSENYEQLRQSYNTAVRRTAVTELEVRDGGITLVVRTADGALQRIPTPFRSEREVYVDYVVVDGRLWIRRVFDDLTPPLQALLVDPQLLAVDWDDEHAVHGKAIYRRLSDGRWMISVSGNGALSLERVKANALTPPLIAAPAIYDYGEIKQQLDAQLQRIRVIDVLARLYRHPDNA